MSSSFSPDAANGRPLPDDFSLGLNPLVNCASHLLAEIVRLRACGTAGADAKEARARHRRLAGGLRGFECAALACGLDGAVVRAAGCLLRAALDESIDSFAPEDRPGPSFPSFFQGEASRDGTFFRIVGHGLRQPSEGLHLLELAYLLLVIGFEGRCRQRPGGDAELRLLREEIYRKVREAREDRLAR